MTRSELETMTVVQLRGIARDHKVILGAGVDKAGIIDKICAAIGNSSADDIPAQDPASVRSSDAVPEQDTPAAPAEPKFQAAWHSPEMSARYNQQHPAAYQGNSYSPAHPSWQNAVPASRMAAPEGRPLPVKPNSFAHRFGPAARQDTPPVPSSAVRTSDPAASPIVSPLPDHRVGVSGNGAFTARPSVPSARPPQVESFTAEPEAGALNLEDLLASGEVEDGSGVLELHPDGYGFLRAPNFLPSSRDIYVSMAQIRRFGLKTGDLIEGKIRPQREGDKYAALLYISSVNGVPEQDAFSRVSFDELTPVYPSRRISLESSSGSSDMEMRLIDLIAPLGFGQRGLLLCPPETGKRELLCKYAHVICENYPDTTVLMLLIDMNPEDVTVIRDLVPCPVLSSTFDQPPEAHLRLAEMVMERAMRLVEQKQDVVILADSLTRLAKIFTTAAVQQGRSVPGMVNPASLLRAKRLFGAARACKEGGSLSVIAAMDIANGNRVDDSLIEEFKGTANMELMLDQSVARAGVSPAINLQHSFTKNADILLNDRQKEGLSLIRQMLGSTTSAAAIPQLLSMMEKTATNSELLLKIKDWFALMNR